MFRKLTQLCLTFYVLIISQLYGVENHSVRLDVLTESFSLEKGEGGLILSIQLADGWKMYAPPDASDTLVYPPEVVWHGSENLKDATPTWPFGKETETAQEIAHVYTEQVRVPLKIVAREAGKPVFLKGVLKILTCSTVCLPQEIPFQLTLNKSVQNKEVQTQVSEALAAQELAQEQLSLPLMLCFALLGGLILNVMPCVLPVLGLKFLVFANQKQRSPAHMRQNFLLTILGIMVSFGFLAALTLSLKWLNYAVGWGLHFQNPYFLAVMIVVLSFFTASFWGFYEFQPPLWVNKLLKPSPHLSSQWSAFASGVLATLLATPCSAPFVGTAVGFALARNPLDIVAVFFCLSLGFSAPYVLALLVPSGKLPLPKPGIWMVYTQRVLGGLLAGTILWLVWLLDAHQSHGQLLATCLLLVGGLLLLWLGAKYQRWRWTGICFLGLIVGIPAVPHWFPAPRAGKQTTEAFSPVTWMSFNPEAIQPLLKEGKSVFVDVTAAWCVTCQLNKQVLQAALVEKVLTNPRVVSMRGDLTKPAPQIIRFLAKFGRAGIPFNVVFTPKAPGGILLPEILTERKVLDAFE